jgi:hypothetical protein
MLLNLDEHDQTLVTEIRAAILAVLSNAHNRTAVAKRISVLATAQRNRGRRAALAHNRVQWHLRSQRAAAGTRACGARTIRADGSVSEETTAGHTRAALADRSRQ